MNTIYTKKGTENMSKLYTLPPLKYGYADLDLPFKEVQFLPFFSLKINVKRPFIFT